CSLKSSRSKPLPFFTFSASFCAFSRSTCLCASSTSDTMSPMPRMRAAMRSGWNGSRPFSFSAVPANLIGLPVTLRTQSAAPPRAAVELGQHDAGERQALAERACGVDRILALHRVYDEERLRRLERGLQRRDLLHHLLVDAEPAGGVDDQHVVIVGFRELDC